MRLKTSRTSIFFCSEPSSSKLLSYDTSFLKRTQVVVNGDVESNPGPTNNPTGTPRGRKRKNNTFNFARKKLDMDILASSPTCKVSDEHPITTIDENSSIDMDSVQDNNTVAPTCKISVNHPNDVENSTVAEIGSIDFNIIRRPS